MGFVNTAFGLCGFGLGVSAGVAVGYYALIFHQPTDVKDPEICPIVERDSESLEEMLPNIPLWVKNPDFHRIDWLNKIIEKMWPYLDKAICKSAMEIAKPIIAEQIPNYKIDSVDFKVFTLGSLPPTFQGVKAYTTDDEELIMEPCLRWAGNPNITIAIKSFGLKATLQVIDLQIFATPRVTLKPLVPSFPCFSNISVSVMEKPHVDFGLKVFGADIMSIPGLYRFIQETIKEHICSMYLWPKTLDVQIMDPSKEFKRPIGMLHVKVVRGIGLKKKDLLGKSDPYLKLKITGNKLPHMKTTMKRNNLNPEWNEEFKFIVKDLESESLELVLFDHEMVGKHKKIGTNVIPLNDLNSNEFNTFTLDLLETMERKDVQIEKSFGQIVVEVLYSPFKEEMDVVEKNSEGTPPVGGGLLVVTVHKAEYLEGKYHVNPYVHVLFRGEKKKTRKIMRTRDPRWEEEFHYICEQSPVDDKMLFEVFSKPSNTVATHFKENLGYVQIRLADVISNKRINEKFSLIDSKSGRLHIEIQWKPPS